MHCLCHEEERQTNEFTKINDINSYQQRALLWAKYEHSYIKVYKAVDWGKSGEFYAHKSCKGLLCKYAFMNSQLEK